LTEVELTIRVRDLPKTTEELAAQADKAQIDLSRLIREEIPKILSELLV